MSTATEDRVKVVANLRALIEGRRDTVIPAVHAAIKNHIKSRPVAECLTIVARSSEGGAIVESFVPKPPGKRYVTALTSFIRKKPFEGKTLDSALSDSTAEVVSEAFAKDLEAVTDRMTDALIPYLLRSEKFVDGVAAAISSQLKGVIPAHLQARVSHALAAKLKTALAQNIDTTSVAAIKASIGKVVGASISTPVATKLAVLMVHTLSTTLKPILIKLLASSALKAAILSKIKAVVIASVLGAFIKLLAVKLGLTAGAAFVWIVMPIVVAWIAYEAAHFPEKLATKVAEGVSTDMRNNFPQTSSTIAETVAELAIVQGAGLLARTLAGEQEIIDFVQSVVLENAA